MRRNSGHDDFVAEAPRGDDQQQRADDAKSESVAPEMLYARAPENDAACDVDEVSRRNQVAERVENCRYGFPRKDIARKKHARQNRQERELHGFRLRCSFARDQDSERERGKKIWQGKSEKQNHVAVNGHEENKAHKKE